MSEEKKWDVPGKGESWTADQLAKYLGLEFNEDFAKGDPVPPYLFRDKDAFIQGVREQIRSAFQPAKIPSIIVPKKSVVVK